MNELIFVIVASLVVIALGWLLWGRPLAAARSEAGKVEHGNLVFEDKCAAN